MRTVRTTNLEVKSGAPRLLLGIDEAAEALGVSRAYLYRDLIAKGLIRPLKIGRATKIATSELERYVAGLIADQQRA
jgi:excisionase family DNA binding protein